MKFAGLFSFIVAFAVANAAVVERATDATACTCAGRSYDWTNIDNAIVKAELGGGGGYPHLYDNYQDFEFKCSGALLEYPIMTGGIYIGGYPGPDRVIYNATSAFCGCITHTGATDGGFLECNF